MEWIEITQDNVDDVYHMYDIGIPIHFAYKSSDGKIIYGSKDSFGNSFKFMARAGRHYYFVLPKLE